VVHDGRKQVESRTATEAPFNERDGANHGQTLLSIEHIILHVR